MSVTNLPKSYYYLAASAASLEHKADALFEPAVVGANPSEVWLRALAAEACEQAAESIKRALVRLEATGDLNAQDALARINGAGEVAA